MMMTTIMMDVYENEEEEEDNDNDDEGDITR
jgi:hypothetical protein